MHLHLCLITPSLFQTYGRAVESRPNCIGSLERDEYFEMLNEKNRIRNLCVPERCPRLQRSEAADKLLQELLCTEAFAGSLHMTIDFN